MFGDCYRGRRVLVTGHTGFKGAWLAHWLLELGAEVTGFSLPPPTEPSAFALLGLSERLTHIEGDIRDIEGVRAVWRKVQPEFVFHLAAQSLVRLSYQDPLATYSTNVMGTAHVLEATRHLVQKGGGPVTMICVTTDKCYENHERLSGYQESDAMGGHDPYSSSKGAAELIISAYRRSYFPPAACRTENLRHWMGIASARAGNVIGGGDWAADRILPDCVRCLLAGEAIPVRHKKATRPWQHVLEPLSGYLWLGARIDQSLRRREIDQLDNLCSAFNFGPSSDSNKTVAELVEEVLRHWPGKWEDRPESGAVHESHLLNLAIHKACHLLQWSPAWDFATTIEKTISWYRFYLADQSAAVAVTRSQIAQYVDDAAARQIRWAHPTCEQTRTCQPRRTPRDSVS